VKQNWFLYDGSLLRDVSKEIIAGEKKQRSAAAAHIKKKIKEKASKIKKTGNLARGVYSKNDENVSFIGIHAPGFQNFLIEFGHYAGKATKKGERKLTVLSSGKKRWTVEKVPSEGRKWVPPHPIVYPTFSEEADAVRKIMSEPWIK